LTVSQTPFTSEAYTKSEGDHPTIIHDNIAAANPLHVAFHTDKESNCVTLVQVHNKDQLVQELEQLVQQSIISDSTSAQPLESIGIQIKSFSLD